jgi:hypothetical protein
MKNELFTLLGKLTFAVLCILAFLAVGKFVGCGIVTAWDRQAQGEQAYINSHKADIQAHWNKDN